MHVVLPWVLKKLDSDKNKIKSNETEMVIHPSTYQVYMIDKNSKRVSINMPQQQNSIQEAYIKKLDYQKEPEQEYPRAFEIQEKESNEEFKTEEIKTSPFDEITAVPVKGSSGMTDFMKSR